MNATKLIRHVFDNRIKHISRYQQHTEQIQFTVLTNLLKAAQNTEWGKQYGYKAIQSYNDFKNNVPIQTYEELKPFVERMRAGEQNLIWHSSIHSYAKSSGTTNDKSKFLPVSKEALRDTHYRGGADCCGLYFQINPSSRFFSGKGLILGGSYAKEQVASAIVGDLSAILIKNINPLANLIRVPSKEIALMDEWEAKIEAIVNSTLDANITNISGVPSWLLVVIKNVLAKANKQTLNEVWPNLEVFFHGGVSFTPYRAQYKELIPTNQMHYVETYNASEGFFGIQNDLSDPAMLLMIDYGVFYEFISMDQIESDSPQAICLADVELHKNYAMLISTSSGLWRYLIGDTVKFTSKDPYKFIITGRTKHFINAFGEELIVDNAEKGLQAACEATGAVITDYTAAPVFMDQCAKCSHQWLIEFAKKPTNLSLFEKTLDATLQTINSDYEAKRHKDIALQPLTVVVAREYLFMDWLRERGKLGGQHKVPRLSNTREYMDAMLALNKNTKQESHYIETDERD